MSITDVTLRKGGLLALEQLAPLRVRLDDLMRLRRSYEARGKHHLVVFIDHLVDDARADIAKLEREPAAIQPPSDAPFTAPQDPDARL